MLQLTTSPTENLEDPIELEMEQELETSNLLQLNQLLHEPKKALDSPMPLDIHLIILEYLTEEDFLVWAKHPQGIHALRKYFVFNATKLTTFIYSGEILEQINTNSSRFENKHSKKLKIGYSILALAITGLSVFSTYKLISIAYERDVQRENSIARTNHLLVEIVSHCPSIFSNTNGCTILPFAVGQDIYCNLSPCDKMMNTFFNNCYQTHNLQRREDYSTWNPKYDFERANGRCAQSIFDRMPLCAPDTFSAYWDSCPSTLDLSAGGFYVAAAFIIIAEIVCIFFLCACYFMKNYGFMNKPASTLAIEEHSASQVVFKRILKTKEHITIGELKNILSVKKNDTDKEQSLPLNHHGLFKLRPISEIRQQTNFEGMPASHLK